MRIWFHGTNAEASKVILREGFNPQTYFARALEDALEFGGDHVFGVALDYEPVIDGNWQMCVGVSVPESAIVWLKRYSIDMIVKREDRLQVASQK